jgi:hypothetical protein
MNIKKNTDKEFDMNMYKNKTRTRAKTAKTQTRK